VSRSYSLYALSDKRKADRITGAIKKVDGVHHVKISEDLRELHIDMEDEKISDIMDHVVNICSKISHGCEIRYKFV
jgi:copper chaperone CopZ